MHIGSLGQIVARFDGSVTRENSELAAGCDEAYEGTKSYSSLKATEGSVCDERSAGAQHASTPTSVRIAGTMVKVNMSRLLLRNSIDSTLPATANARILPAITPMAINRTQIGRAACRGRVEIS